MHHAAASGAHDDLCLCPSQRSEERYGERGLAPRLLLSIFERLETIKRWWLERKPQLNSEKGNILCIYIYVMCIYIWLYYKHVYIWLFYKHTIYIYTLDPSIDYFFKYCAYIYNIYIYTYTLYKLIGYYISYIYIICICFRAWLSDVGSRMIMCPAGWWDLEHEFYDFPYVGNSKPNWLS